MPLGANIELANTFNDWRIRTNEILSLLGTGGGVVLLNATSTGNASITGLFSANAFSSANGTVSSPAHRWTSDPDSGDWLSGDGVISRSIAGVTKFQHSATGLVVASDITIGFKPTANADAGTVDAGISRSAANTLAVLTNGTSRLTVNVTTIAASIPVTAPNNSVIGTLTSNSTFVTTIVPVTHPDGVVGNPGVRFTENTGLYMAAAGDLRISLLGASAAQINATAFAIQGTRNLTVATAAVAGIFGAGNTTVTGTLATGNTTVTGTLATGNTTVTGTLASGNTTHTGTLATGNTTITGTLASGNTTVTGSVSASTILNLGTTLVCNTTALIANVAVRCDQTNGRLVLPVGTDLWAV